MTHEEIFAYPAFRPSKPLTEPFGFAVIGAAHGHIYEMCNKLIREGAELKYLYDRDPLVLADLAKRYPQAQVCEENEILDKQDIRLIASAAVPARRADIGIRAMRAGKDYFVDKAPMTTLEQVAEVRRVCAETGRKCFVFYGESVSNESTVFALDLVRRGIIGDVFHVTGSAPHRLNLPSRPEWFFHRENTGGILIDLGGADENDGLLLQAHTDGRVPETVCNRTIIAKQQSVFQTCRCMFLKHTPFLLNYRLPCSESSSSMLRLPLKVTS